MDDTKYKPSAHIQEPSGLFIQALWYDGASGTEKKYVADLRGGAWGQWCDLARAILAEEARELEGKNHESGA